MLLKELRGAVLDANLELVRKGLVLYTFGNASGISREQGLVVIKPSGVPYEHLRPEHMVVTDLEGKVVEGELRPSSDLQTHLVLYRSFPGIGGIVHTHSEHATAWAQACRPIPCLGTTHADYFHGLIPVTRPMTETEIETEYETNTGHAIVRAFQGIDPSAIPAVLVANHGPFTWGPDVATAAQHAVVLESTARMAWMSITIDQQAASVSQFLLDKHFHRKHGRNAYYGQSKPQA